jgi:multiple sugar transport system substrate-binding protein
MKLFDRRKGKPERSERRSALSLRLGGALLILGLLVGCSQWLEPFFPGLFPPDTPEPTLSNGVVATPQPEATLTFEPLPTISGPVTLTIWVPPQFDPQGDSPEAEILQNRLDEFMEENPGVLVVTRIKAPSGPGGLLEALTAASAAAPGAMPSLIALNRADLEAAALKGLIFPIEGVSAQIDNPDWFPYARQLGSVQDSPFGLPFAGDALVVLYRPAAFGGIAPNSWEDILAQGAPLIFHADDSQALVTTALYRSVGGVVQDIQGRPFLDPDALTEVLLLYEDGARRGTFPTWLTQYQTAGQAWQAYRENQADWVISWSSNYLSELPPDTNLALLPSLNNSAYTQATGWVWALADPDLEHHELSIRLAEFLVESPFLSEWSAAAGFLPTRPAALTGWPNQSLQALLSQVVLSAQVRPPNEILTSLGPVMREAVVAVLRDQSDPAQAALLAVEKLGAP